ncbi:MAG: alpha/beta hydrolase [Chloroflexi bacterium]|nr:MAG: alpha/beta hydrolase [Chloroflexota bacterium]
MKDLPNRTQQTLHLPGGRQLGYAEYGDPEGKPLFYFHGWPSSRIEFGGYKGDEIAKRLHVRVISADRPGFGLSSYKSHYHFKDWPEDVACLADHLGFGKFAIAGYSASSPYTLACAHALSDRLTAVGVVSGLSGPLSIPGAAKGMPTIMLWTTARIHPRLTWFMFKMMKNTITNAPRDILPKSAKQAMMAEADFAFIKDHPYAMAANMDGGVEALRQGGLGPAEAAALYWKPWGFDLKDIRTKVHLWHGEDDLNAPFAAHGKVLAQKLTNVEAKFYPGEGHISLIHKYLDTILQTLTA